MQDSKNFVEFRLKQVFGRLDIFDYLSSRPDPPAGDENSRKIRGEWNRTWKKVAKGLFSEEELKEFEAVILPHLPPLHRYDSHEQFQFINLLLSKLHGDLKIYQVWGMFLLDFPSHDMEGERRFITLGSKSYRIEPEDFVSFVACTIDPMVRNLGGWDCILGRLRKAVEVETNAAKWDFRLACAVSSDGTKVVIADQVYLADHRAVVTTHSASEFQRDKLIRPDDMKRFDDVTDSGMLNSLVQAVGHGLFSAVYAVRQETGTRIFIAHDEPVDLAP